MDATAYDLGNEQLLPLDPNLFLFPDEQIPEYGNVDLYEDDPEYLELQGVRTCVKID